MEAAFELPTHSCAFVDDANAANVVVLLTAATIPSTEASNFAGWSDARDAMKRGAEVVVLIDKMSDAGWDVLAYQRLKGEIKSLLKEHPQTLPSSVCVPIPTFTGDNFLELCAKAPWYSRKSSNPAIITKPMTVVEALDARKQDNCYGRGHLGGRNLITR